MTKPNESTRYWLGLIFAVLGLIVMGSAAGGRMNARVETCEQKIERSSDKLDQMADDISYMRGRFDMLMEQQAQRKRGAK